MIYHRNWAIEFIAVHDEAVFCLFLHSNPQWDRFPDRNLLALQGEIPCIPTRAPVAARVKPFENKGRENVTIK